MELMILHIIIVAILSYCAYLDVYNKRQIPDIWLAVLWTISLGINAELTAVAFAWAFGLNTSTMFIRNKTIFSWADILALPVYSTSMILLTPTYLLQSIAAISLLCTTILCWFIFKDKDEFPLFPVLALSLLLTIGVSFIFSLF